jgi:hypothetical protein
LTEPKIIPPYTDDEGCKHIEEMKKAAKTGISDDEDAE